ncbi:Unknown protein sequence [Pseudomonas syringae pv. viburni]|uniref:Uncharacterized protein n=1 Tax=Pseudomonas syringae pv. viburni TaxID=251703 RepID=A0A0Q0KF69_9PSED|nr:Unknown protein sequence [Pseudomonas syringae pv. viburni]
MVHPFGIHSLNLIKQFGPALLQVQTLELRPIITTGRRQTGMAAGLFGWRLVHCVPAQAFHQSMGGQPALGLLAQIPRQRPTVVQQVASGFDGRDGGRSLYVRVVADRVLRHQRIHPAGLCQPGGQCTVQSTQGRALILRPRFKPVLQPGQHSHRPLSFAAHHFGVARQAVQYLAAGQPFQRHLAAVGSRRQHLGGVTLHQCRQQGQPVSQSGLTVFLQTRPQVISGHPQVLAGVDEQFLCQLHYPLGICPGQFIDLLAHTLEVIVITWGLTHRRACANRLQPRLPVLGLTTGQSQCVAVAQALGDQGAQAHSKAPFCA